MMKTSLTVTNKRKRGELKKVQKKFEKPLDNSLSRCYNKAYGEATT